MVQKSTYNKFGVYMKMFYLLMAICLSNLLFTACKDTVIEPTKDNIYTIKVIDANTKQALSNVGIAIYYKIEPVNLVKKIIEDENTDILKEPLIYPNPFSFTFRYSIGFEKQCLARIELCEYESNKMLMRISDNLPFEKGNYELNINSDAIVNYSPGIYKFNLYINDTLARTTLGLYTPKWFVGDKLLVPSYGEPFKTLLTSNSGIIEIDKNDFTLCKNYKFTKSDEYGYIYGDYQIVNGFYCFIYQNGKMVAQKLVRFDSNSRNIIIEVNN